MELKRYIQILWRRRRTLILVVAIIMLTAFLSSELVSPVYKSTARVAIKMVPQSGLISEIPKNFGALQYFNQDFVVGTIESLLESEGAVGRVIRNLDLRDSTGDFFGVDGFLNQNFLSIIFLTKKGVEIEYLMDSAVFDIIGYSSEPDESAMIANSLVETLLEIDHSKHHKQAKVAQETIERNIDEVQERLMEAEEKEKQFRVREKILDIDKQVDTFIDELAALEAAKNAAELSLQEAYANRGAITTKITSESGSGTYKSNEILGDASNLRSYKDQLLNLEMKLADLLTELTPEHVGVKSVKNQIEIVKEAIKNEIARVIALEVTSFYDPIVDKYATAEIDIVTFTARLNVLSKQIDKLNEKLKDIPRKQLEFIRLNTRVRVLRDRYATLLNDLGIAKLAEVLDLANIEVIYPASLSDNIENNLYFPMNTTTTFVLSSIMGIFMGIFWIFVLEYLDERTYNPDELEESSGLPVLGRIPLVRRRVARRVLTKGESVFTRATWRLQLNLKELIGDKKVIAVVSSFRGEGKSTICVHLGVLFARSRLKTLLIDFDLRRPTLHKAFRVRGGTGVTNAVRNRKSEKVQIHETDYENLSLMTCGSSRLSSFDILNSPHLPQVMEKLRSEYDLILVDTSDIQGGNDALIISAQADQVLLVTSIGKVILRKLKNAKASLENMGSKIVGLVINRCAKK